MSDKLYIAYNGHSPTTAAVVKVATGTAIKTLLQLVPAAAGPALRIVEWGISFDGSAMAAPGTVELIETGAIAATVTAFSSSAPTDAIPLNDPNAPASTIQMGTSTSGFTASAEGTITATRVLDAQLLDPIAPYVKQFPLGYEPEIKAGNIGRIRVTFATTVNALCYIVWKE